MENHPYSKSLKSKPFKCVLFKGRIAPVVTRISSDIGISSILVQYLSAVKIHGRELVFFLSEWTTGVLLPGILKQRNIVYINGN